MVMRRLLVKKCKSSIDEIESQIESVEDQLDEIIEIQKNLLYWVRIIGIFFLFGSIGSFLIMMIQLLENILDALKLVRNHYYSQNRFKRRFNY